MLLLLTHKQAFKHFCHDFICQGWDPLSEAEQSILVSKVPATATTGPTTSRSQTPSMFGKKVPVQENHGPPGSGQTHYAGSAVSPGNKSGYRSNM